MSEVNRQIIERNVSDIFGKSQYIVPIYQRNYAWGQEQIECLIEDIVDFNQTEEVEEYFLGNLIVDKTAHHQYSVIDGQQRLTTLFLLLNYLKFPSVNADSLVFESREKSNVTLKRIAEGRIDNDEFTSDEIILGYKIIEQYFDAKKEKLDDFKNKLEHIKLLRIQVPKDIDLNHYFEIMNTRGEQLELHEVAKARILEMFTNKMEDKTKEEKETALKEQKIAAMIWDACSNMESYIQMNFSKSVRYALFGKYDANNDEKGWGQFTATNFSEVYEKLSSIKTTGESTHFLLKNILNDISIENQETNDSDDDEQERFTPIIDFPNFLLQVNAAAINDSQNDDSLDDKYFMKTLQHNWEDEDSARQFIFSMILTRFKFDKFIIKRDKQRDLDGDGKWSLKRLYLYRQTPNSENQDKPQYKNTFDDEAKNNQLLTLQASMRVTFTSPKVMHWITEVLQLELSELTNETIISKLEKHCINKLGNYRAYTGFAFPRVVFTYLDYVLWRDNHPNVDKNWEIVYRTSIEHFSPQHPADGKEPWVDNELNSFGNLALINVKSNSMFSNLAPESKIDTFGSAVHQSPKLQLMEKIVKDNNNSWKYSDAENLKDEMFNILDKEVNTL